MGQMASKGYNTINMILRFHNLALECWNYFLLQGSATLGYGG